MRFSLIIFLILLVSLNSCNDNSVNPYRGTQFYPINIGNRWEYKAAGYDSLGNLEYEGNFSESFTEFIVLDNQPVYQIQSPLYHSPACCQYKFFFQNNNDGVHFLTYYLGWIYNNLVYKYPCSENDFFISGNHNDTTFVISINDTVNCDAGKFECIVYKNITKDFSDTTFIKILGYSYTYVAKAVGKVKFESYWSNSIGIFYKSNEYSLTNYTFK